MVLFQEVKAEMEREVEPVRGVDACSGDNLHSNAAAPPNLVLEMTELGRGTEHYDAEVRWYSPTLTSLIAYCTIVLHAML